MDNFKKWITAGKFTAFNKWRGKGAVDNRQRKCHQRVQLLALIDCKHHYTTKKIHVFEVYRLLPLKLVLVYRMVRLLLVLLLGRWAAA